MPSPRPLRRSLRPAAPQRPFGAGRDGERGQRATGGSTEAIGKVAVFGDATLAGRVTDVVFEQFSGDIVAYEVDPGDGSACFVAAALLTHESPVSLHFPAASPLENGNLCGTDAGEFLALDHLPDPHR